MFEYLGDRLTNAIKNIRGLGAITEENIGDAMREIRMALLEADVNYQVVKEFVANVKEKALGMEVGKSLKPDELFIKIVKDELVSLLGGDVAQLETKKKSNHFNACWVARFRKNNNCWKTCQLLTEKGKQTSFASCL